MLENLKIAIVYDWFDKWGGVERVLLTLHEMFPQAPFYTSYIDKDRAQWTEGLDVKTSFIQDLPYRIRRNRVLSIPLYPFAFESFEFNDYDVVISVTSSFAKTIVTKPGTPHICYLLTPTRFLWSHEDQYFPRDLSNAVSWPYKQYLRTWDYAAAQRPDHLISLSQAVEERCQRYYHRQSDVIYPPFDIVYWEGIKSKIKSKKSKLRLNSQKYFLIVSRLEPYKKVDIAIKTFNKLPDLNLTVVGTGSQENTLRKLAGDNIRFMPRVSDEELAGLYANAEVLLMPQEEDFGYVSLEAQFFGCPVLAFMKGGAKETVINHQSGLLFSNQTVAGLKGSLEEFHTMSYNLKDSTQKVGPENARRFDKKIFVEQFQSAISLNVKPQISKLHLKTINL